MKTAGLLAIAVFVLTGCAMKPPSSNVHQPMSTRPQPMQSQVDSKGSIFPTSLASNASYRPLFEDYRARNVGDTLTIVLNERTNASTSANSNASRSSEVNTSIDVANKIPGSGALGGLGFGGSGENTFSGGGGSNANNVFTGNITVTVIEVLPNGNLLVSGEKVISINHGDEYIRFSGVVNPIQLRSDNTVISTQVADARVEYKSRGYISEAQVMSWLARFFLNVLPL